MAKPIDTVKAAFAAAYPGHGVTFHEDRTVPLLITRMKEKTIGYNPDGLSELQDFQLKWLGAHEAEHAKVYDRHKGRSTWDIASDLVINDLLRDAGTKL